MRCFPAGLNLDKNDKNYEWETLKTKKSLPQPRTSSGVVQLHTLTSY